MERKFPPVGEQRPVMVWRGICLIMSLFFLLSAYFNINDSDFYIWVPIYLLPALLSLPLVFNPSIRDTTIWSTVLVIHLALCFAYSIYAMVLMVEAISGKLENPLIHEEGREMGGLMIIMAWLGVARFTNIGRSIDSTPNRTKMNALLVVTLTLTVCPLVIWSLCTISDWHTRLGHCHGMFA